MQNGDDGYITSSKVLVRFGDISRMTLQRWVRDPELGFPQPLIIGQRWYFKKSELDDWERQQREKSNIERQP